MKTLVLGLGNPILTDDGVGVRVAEAVRRALPLDTPVEVSEASVGGLGLMERMVGYERVILIDALYEPRGGPGPAQSPSTSPTAAGARNPGAFYRLTLDDLQAISPPQHTASAHDTSLDTALAMGRRMGLSLPREIIIYAIEVENIMDFGEAPTPAVARAIPQVTAAVLSELL
jgi:hydrogenase maturation protease